MVDHAYDPNAAAGSGQAEPNSDGERVAKALARAGVASRREIERLIAAGRVKLNGKVLDTPAVKIAPGDVLMVDGAVIAQAEATRVWRYHKPAGLVTTHSDPKGRPTGFAHLPEGLPRVISVGRLDLNTEGCGWRPGSACLRPWPGRWNCRPPALCAAIAPGRAGRPARPSSTP